MIKPSEFLMDVATGEYKPEGNENLVGLCSLVQEHCEVKINLSMFKGWKHYSGNKLFPVPATTSPHMSAFEEYAFNRNLYIGKQGELRRDLARYLADKYKEQGM